jgi:hypothetical protein
MICENCGIEHEGNYGSGRFCSSKCARGFSTSKKRKEINNKISKKISDKKRFVTKECPVCNESFIKEWKRRKQKTCSRKCGYKWLYHKDNPEYKNNKLNARKAGLKSVESQKEKRRSKNEKLLYEMIKEVYSDTIHNESMFNGWDADIIIPSKKIAILWNGKWHYEKITKSHSVKQVQNRDMIKINEIRKCGYTAYVVKDMGKYNPDFVKEQFDNIKTELLNNKM